MKSSMQAAGSSSTAVVATERACGNHFARRLLVLGALLLLVAGWEMTWQSGVGLADDKAAAKNEYKPVAPVDVLMARADDVILVEMENHMYGKAKWSARKVKGAAFFLAELMNVTAHHSAEVENPAEWKGFSEKSRDLILELAAAGKKKDEAKAKELVGAKGAIESGKIYASCEACHKVYRD